MLDTFLVRWKLGEVPRPKSGVNPLRFINLDFEILSILKESLHCRISSKSQRNTLRFSLFLNGPFY